MLPTRPLRIVIIMLLAASLTAVSFAAGAKSSRPQDQLTAAPGHKLLTRQHRFANEPLEVIDVEVKGQRLKLRGKPASIDEASDWLRGLVVRFKNVSDKPISGVEFHLALADPNRSADLITFTLKYGRTTPAAAADSAELLMPGATAQLALSAAWYDEANLSLKRNGNSPLTAVDRADLGLSYVYFADETNWRPEPLARQGQ